MNENEYTFNFQDTTAKNIMAVVECLLKKEGNIEYISKYVGTSKEYIRRSINFAIDLGIIIKDISEDRYRVSPNTKSLSLKFDENTQLIFRDYLFHFEPFIFVVSRLLTDDTPMIAIRKMKAVFQINTHEKIIKKVFDNFCRYIDIEEFNKESFLSIIEIKKEINTNKIIKILNNEFEINLFTVEKLGNKCYNYLEKSERILFVDSINTYTSNPANSISDSVGAFESFLRRLAMNKGINVEQFNGISQIAQYLSSKDIKLILPEHRNLCEFIGTFRNPSSHKVQKNILKHWKINDDSAIEIILLCLSTTRSIYDYVYESKLIL